MACCGSIALVMLDSFNRLESLPDVLILDEPELGLHPYAINVVGGLIRAASSDQTQVIVATQSAAFVDCFDPEDIVVVEREARRSVICPSKLDTKALEEWLEALFALRSVEEERATSGRP